MSSNEKQHNSRIINVLLVEDSPSDAILTIRAIESASTTCNIQHVVDGEVALETLQKLMDEKQPLPDVILLDLNLPRMNGQELLERIRAHESLRRLPVVVLTTSRAEKDVVSAYERQVNAYLSKPVDVVEFKTLMKSFDEFWLNRVILPPPIYPKGDAP